MNWQQTRKKTLDRDGYACRFCGMTNDEHKDENECGLHAHHILKDGEGGRDHPENLITVCESCHQTLEHTHADAIAELKHQRENETAQSNSESEKKTLKKLSAVHQKLGQKSITLEKRLADYVENNPLTADALGLYVDEADVVSCCSTELTTHTDEAIDSEFQFAAFWGYARGLERARGSYGEADSNLGQRDVTVGDTELWKLILHHIDELDDKGGDGAPIDKVYQRVRDEGFSQYQAEIGFTKLKHKGEVYEPTSGHFRTTQ